MRKESKKEWIYVYIYITITLVYIWDSHNTLNQLYSNWKNLKEIFFLKNFHRKERWKNWILIGRGGGVKKRGRLLSQLRMQLRFSFFSHRKGAQSLGPLRSPNLPQKHTDSHTPGVGTQTHCWTHPSILSLLTHNEKRLAFSHPATLGASRMTGRGISGEGVSCAHCVCVGK